MDFHCYELIFALNQLDVEGGLIEALHGLWLILGSDFRLEFVFE